MEAKMLEAPETLRETLGSFPFVHPRVSGCALFAPPTHKPHFYNVDLACNYMCCFVTESCIVY